MGSMLCIRHRNAPWGTKCVKLVSRSHLTLLLCDISSLWASVFSPVKWEGWTLQSLKLFPNLKFPFQEVYNLAGTRSCKVNSQKYAFKAF